VGTTSDDVIAKAREVATRCANEMDLEGWESDRRTLAELVSESSGYAWQSDALADFEAEYGEERAGEIMDSSEVEAAYRQTYESVLSARLAKAKP
jgi:hypothetical protein